MAAIDYDHVRSLLNMPDLTDTAVKSILDSKGIKSEAGAEKWASSNANPGTGGFWSHGFGALEQSVEHPGSVKIGPGGLEESPAAKAAIYGTPGPGAPADPQQKAHAAQVQKQQAAARTKALQQQVATSPWTVMGDYLAQQYGAAASSAQGLMDPYAGGANSKNAEMAGAATQNALALTGLSPNSSAAGWLAQQQQAANAVDAPVAQAMGQEAGVYSKMSGPISQAILNFGQANALGEITAPESAWLNALATHITSNLSYYGEVPTAALPTFQANPALGSAIQQSGGYGGAGGAGLTPVANVPTLGGQTKVSGSTQALAGIGAGGTSYGSIPTAGGTPSS